VADPGIDGRGPRDGGLGLGSPGTRVWGSAPSGVQGAEPPLGGLRRSPPEAEA